MIQLAKHLTAILLGVVIAGCGASSGRSGTTKASAALTDVGEIYRLYSAEHNKPPKTLKDIETLRPVGPAGARALETGEVILLYGEVMTDTGEQVATPSNRILAYEKKVPESGGEVLLLDRRVTTMSAEEFKAAPKAGK